MTTARLPPMVPVTEPKLVPLFEQDETPFVVVAFWALHHACPTGIVFGTMVELPIPEVWGMRSSCWRALSWSAALLVVAIWP